MIRTIKGHSADKVIYVKNGTVEDIFINEHPKDADEINW
jgi:putative ABC transport system ATP-binding protein